MNKTTNFSSLGVSICLHAVLLGALAAFQMSAKGSQPEVILETVFDEERVQEEFTQELETETEIAETKNFISGGAVSSAVGGSAAPAVAQTKIDTSESLKEPEIQVNVGDITLPGEELLGQDLGEEQITGEVGAVVEGYGAALGRITQELIRLMRERKVLVVWLFDESESMKDDQKEIAQKFHKVYQELGIQQQKDDVLKKQDQVLQTVILGFGEKIDVLTKKPTGSVPEIQAAIDKIKVDDSGTENMCQSIAAVCNEYGPKARSQNRRLVTVVVSDESPSDFGKVEDAVEVATKFDSPVYILGREAIFGYPYARIRWKDPVYNLTHWVRIDRGPETAQPECLQYNGIGARWDSFSSGFGPYSQVRICKETGGIFFLLPGEEQNLTGPGAHEKRKFDALAMKEYEPLLKPDREYVAERNKSKFRSTIWDVIYRLNPHLDSMLSVRLHHYSIEHEEFRNQGQPQFERASRAMTLLNQAVTMLERIEGERSKEESQRWRANYDLALAQCIAYRIRLFQYLLVLDAHVKNQPKVSDPKHNEWNIGWTKQMLVPDDDQFKRVKTAFKLKENREEYLEVLKKEEARSRAMFDEVYANHPGTPWARRAQFELGRGYGMHIRSGFRDPRYRDVGKKIKIPKF